jgi:SNF family Na+-dependent transporter
MTTAPSEQTGRMNWFDQQFSQIGWPMLIALMVLFSVLMWVFSGIGLIKTHNPVAHRKAKIIFIVCTVYIACCGVVIYILARHPQLLD